MTTSDTVTDPRPRPRLLRRSRTNRIAAGVASGLGDYFRIDPVLFRVLFATSAFFGGAGILAYLLAWAAIPDEHAERAPIDGWVAGLRARRFPVWIAVAVGGLLFWAVAFSWWAPGPFFPVIAVVVLIVVYFTRREVNSQQQQMQPTVPLAKPDAPEPSAPTNPSWVVDARAWFEESRAAARARRRRSFPIRLGVLLAVVASIAVLAIADAIGGIQFQWYFWTVLMIVGAGLITAAATRRWTWSLVPLLIPATIGAIAFAGSDTSLHDGFGQREWKPVTTTSADYRLAFGQAVLDLRDLQPSTSSRFDVTLGAGQVKVIVPRTSRTTIDVDVHFGNLEVDGQKRTDGAHFTRTIDPPAGATGTPVTVHVHLADGNVRIVRT